MEGEGEGEGEGKEKGEGENVEGPFKSSFSFISQTPPEQPLPEGEKEEEREKKREGRRGTDGGGGEEGNEESGFSFLLSASRPGEGKDREGRELDLLTAADKGDHSNSPLTSYNIPPLLPNSPPPITSATSLEEPGSQPHPPPLSVRNRLGVVSPVPGPTNTSPSPSHPPADRSHVGKQQPVAEKKKKKKKGWR